MDDRPTIAAPDDDPYLWLEEVEGPRALDFVEQQSRITLEKFGGAKFEHDRDALAAIYDRPDNIPYVVRRRGLVYNLWKDDSHPRGLWRRTTLAEFKKSRPQWESLLDVDRLAAEEKADWLLNWAQIAPEGSSRAILSLSRGGSDAVILREFDLDAKAFVRDGFILPEAKGGAGWLDADTLLLASAYGDSMATASGYARTIRRWHRGQNVDQATVIVETTPDHMGLYFEVDPTGATPRVWFVDMIDFLNMDFWLGDETGARVKLDLPTDARVEAHGDWLAVRLRSPWTVGSRSYASDSVLGATLSAFLSGDRNFDVVFEPGPRRALQGFFWAANRLVLPILDELRPAFEVVTPSADGWARGGLPGLPEIGTVDVWRLDRDESEGNGGCSPTSRDR
jgi:prolyl oligopeptidase